MKTSLVADSHGIRRRTGHGFTLVELLVVIAIIGVLVGLLLPAVQAAREAARRSQCTNNLKQMGLGFLNFESSKGVLPGGATVDTDPDSGDCQGGLGCRGTAWSMTIMPYMEVNALSDLYDSLQVDGEVAWHKIADSEIGQTTRIPIYVCPSNSEEFFSYADCLPRKDYFGCAGGRPSSSTYRPDPRQPIGVGTRGRTFTDGMFSLTASNMRMARVTDGMSNTIAIGESMFPQNVGWGPGYGTDMGGPCCWWHGGSGDPENPTPSGLSYGRLLRTVLFPINFSLYQRDGNKTRYAVEHEVAFGSDHPGGAHFVFGDGHVQFISEDIDINTYRFLGTISGEEVVSFSDL